MVKEKALADSWLGRFSAQWTHGAHASGSSACASDMGAGGREGGWGGGEGAGGRQGARISPK